MGFLSFGKKKKADAATVPSLPPKRLSRSSRPANNATTTSTMSATSSGSSSGSPPQPPPVHQEPQRRSLSLAPSRPSGASAAHDVPPVPLIPTSAPAASSSSSLGVPNAPYANRELAKKASTNTLNLTRRGPHSAPPLADCLAKPRSASYHAPQHRNIWVTSASTHGHSMIAANSAVDPRNSKFHSTGGPMVGSYYGDAQFPQQNVSDQEFKFYTKNYETAISKAHSLAREYHHLPPAKRDRQRFEHVGQSFAAAARLSREHWSYRCHLEKERLETLVASGARMSQADVYAQDLSPHRIAGMRATEGWQYASMLADAWGANEEMATPLEDMLTLKPNHPTSSLSGAPSSFTDLGYSSGYMHPGYAPSVFASYATQAVDPSTQTRSRMDSTASKASEAYSTSTHTHTGVSYTLRHSQSHGALSSSGNPIKGYSSGPLNQSKSKPDLSDSPEPIPPLPTSAPVGRTSFSTIEEPITRPPIIKLTKGRRYKERASEAAPTAVAVS